MYKRDLQAAARRHLSAGEILFEESTRVDVAGYLFGLAAECALKALMQSSGMRPLGEEDRRDDPFYAHFEPLKTLLRNSLSGRLSTELRRFAEDSSFMQFWDIRMRYSDGRSTRTTWVQRWQKDARNVIGVMDT